MPHLVQGVFSHSKWLVDFYTHVLEFLSILKSLQLFHLKLIPTELNPSKITDSIELYLPYHLECIWFSSLKLITAAVNWKLAHSPSSVPKFCWRIAEYYLDVLLKIIFSLLCYSANGSYTLLSKLNFVGKTYPLSCSFSKKRLSIIVNNRVVYPNCYQV